MVKSGRQVIAVFCILALCAQGPGACYAQTQIAPPASGMLGLSASFNPAVLRGIRVDETGPFRFGFVLDPGATQISGAQLKTESLKLIKYFLVSLTLPENDLWVNLSPQEADRIIPDEFGATEMGRDLLAQDYLLKQFSAALTNPDTQLGQKYWLEVDRKKPGESWSVSTANTAHHASPSKNNLTKVWIVPDRAVVYQDNGAAFIGETRLKVMMQEDLPGLRFRENDKEDPSSEVFRDYILPVIEQEINEGEQFAPLRQIYHSLILASWYKRALKQSVLSQVYVDQKKVAGIESLEKDAKMRIYEQYLESFKQGVYTVVREEEDVSGEIIPRKYFSGGVTLLASAPTVMRLEPLNRLPSNLSSGPLVSIDIQADPYDASVANQADLSDRSADPQIVSIGEIKDNLITASIAYKQQVRHIGLRVGQYLRGSHEYYFVIEEDGQSVGRIGLRAKQDSRRIEVDISTSKNNNGYAVLGTALLKIFMIHRGYMDWVLESYHSSSNPDAEYSARALTRNFEILPESDQELKLWRMRPQDPLRSLVKTQAVLAPVAASARVFVADPKEPDASSSVRASLSAAIFAVVGAIAPMNPSFFEGFWWNILPASQAGQPPENRMIYNAPLLSVLLAQMQEGLASPMVNDAVRQRALDTLEYIIQHRTRQAAHERGTVSNMEYLSGPNYDKVMTLYLDLLTREDYALALKTVREPVSTEQFYRKGDLRLAIRESMAIAVLLQRAVGGKADAEFVGYAKRLMNLRINYTDFYDTSAGVWGETPDPFVAYRIGYIPDIVQRLHAQAHEQGHFNAGLVRIAQDRLRSGESSNPISEFSADVIALGFFQAIGQKSIGLEAQDKVGTLSWVDEIDLLLDGQKLEGRTFGHQLARAQIKYIQQVFEEVDWAVMAKGVLAVNREVKDRRKAMNASQREEDIGAYKFSEYVTAVIKRYLMLKEYEAGLQLALPKPPGVTIRPPVQNVADLVLQTSTQDFVTPLGLARLVDSKVNPVPHQGKPSLQRPVSPLLEQIRLMNEQMKQQIQQLESDIEDIKRTLPGVASSAVDESRQKLLVELAQRISPLNPDEARDVNTSVNFILRFIPAEFREHKEEFRRMILDVVSGRGGAAGRFAVRKVTADQKAPVMRVLHELNVIESADDPLHETRLTTPGPNGEVYWLLLDEATFRDPFAMILALHHQLIGIVAKDESEGTMPTIVETQLRAYGAVNGFGNELYSALNEIRSLFTTANVPAQQEGARAFVLAALDPASMPSRLESIRERYARYQELVLEFHASISFGNSPNDQGVVFSQIPVEQMQDLNQEFERIIKQGKFDGKELKKFGMAVSLIRMFFPLPEQRAIFENILQQLNDSRTAAVDRRLNFFKVNPADQGRVVEILRAARISDPGATTFRGMLMSSDAQQGGLRHILMLSSREFERPLQLLNTLFHELGGHMLHAELSGFAPNHHLEEIRAYQAEVDFLQSLADNLEDVKKVFDNPDFARTYGEDVVEWLRDSLDPDAISAMIQQAQERVKIYENSLRVQQSSPNRSGPSRAGSALEAKPQEVGGIDLNPDKLDLDLRGQAQSFDLPRDPAQIQDFQFDGLVPVIINIAPIPSLPAFWNLSQEKRPQTLAGS